MKTQLNAKALRQLSSYLTQLEDEVESAILSELEKDPTATETLVPVRSEYVTPATTMLAETYSYDSEIAKLEETTNDGEARVKGYIGLIIKW